MKEIKEQIINFPTNYSELILVINLREEIKNFLKNSDIIPRKGVVLDIGCGTGYFSKYFEDKGYNVDGFDIDRAKIEQARKLYPDINFQIVSDFKPKQNSYDLAFCNMVVCNIESEEKLRNFLKETHQSLNKSGVLFLTNADINDKINDGDQLRHTILSDRNEGSSVLVQLKQSDGNFSSVWENYIWSREKLISILNDSHFQVVVSEYFKGLKYYYILAKKL